MNKSIEDYRVLKIIGKGSFGTCYQVQRISSGYIYVWKEINYGQMSEENKELLVSEVNLLSQLNHPNIVRYFDRIIHKETTTLYLIMEWCQGGDLASLIKKCKKNNLYLEEQFVWKILYQISRALYACHFHASQKTILHRDIKPANIFLDNEGNVKLGDFGLARMLDFKSNFAESFVGTPYYMSPELLKGEKYNKKCDIWALGCVIYEMCALNRPFPATNIGGLISEINFGRISRIPLIYSEDLNTIIITLLKGNTEQRPSIDIILNHPIIISKMISGTLATLKLGNIETKEENKKENIPVHFEKIDKEEEWRLKFETLKRREEAIHLREEALAAREIALTQREKYLMTNVSQNIKTNDSRHLTNPLSERHVRFNVDKFHSQNDQHIIKDNEDIRIYDFNQKTIENSKKVNRKNSKPLNEILDNKKENINFNPNSFKKKSYIKPVDIPRMDRKLKYEFR